MSAHELLVEMQEPSRNRMVCGDSRPAGTPKSGILLIVGSKNGVRYQNFERAEFRSLF